MTALTLEMGRQTFDGLGRQRSVSVAGRTTHYHYRPGQMPPTANTLADGKRVAYTYEAQLGNALLTSQADGEADERLSYHPQHCLPIHASGAQGVQHWHFTPSGQLQQDSWTVDGEPHSTTWHHSLNGLQLGFTDVAGVKHQREHDAFGRVNSVQVGEVRTLISYDGFSRPSTITTEDLASARTLSQHLSYDGMGRESSRTFTLSEGEQTRTFAQALTYSNLDQLVTRTWTEDGQTTEEHFAYDLRGRLVHYTAEAGAAPQDPFGNAIVEQRLRFNALDGLREVLSTFADGSQDTATFRYAENDPTQVVAIVHTHPSWPALIELTYDACGRVIHDSLGRSMAWNSQDRLTRVSYRGSTCHYRYNPSGQLCDRVVDDVLTRSFHSGAQLTHEQQDDQRIELVGDGTLFALNRVSDGVRQSILLGCDGQGSVRLEAGDTLRVCRYSAHGAQPRHAEHTAFGYCGERREPLTDWIIPAGYRPYDPLLMCFLVPDSESPFGRGGINPYAYCGGDPINRTDPDGHSWTTWVLAGTGIAVGIIATAFTFGTAGTAILGAGAFSATGMLAVGTAALNAISLGTGIAAMALEASGKDQKAASILGWISLGTGAASAVTGTLASLRAGASGLKGNALRMPGRAGKVAGRGRRGALHSPLESPPVRSRGGSSVLYETQVNGRGNHDVVWHERFLGSYRALETHGGGGLLMNSSGKMVDPVQLAIAEIAPRLKGVNPAVPFFLQACEGGSNGAAQKLANVLQRPVYGYDKVIALHDIGITHAARRTSQLTSTPIQKISWWRRLLGEKGPFSDYRKYEDARGRFYYPR
ncbi:RHS repeat-associated core domain-containing protein [Pseudomonas sichuanensis]|uniref:RHS repeat-associated core domain-containing protein n=1 Tax=Pseudomonas sichuanensis TaxID=2213015 RepID=A0ABV0DEI3_9PSED